MRKKLQSTTSKLWASAALAAILVIWQAVSMAGLVPGYMLPSPVQVVRAFISEFPLLMENSRVTLLEAAAGLFCGVVFGFVMAVLMDRFDKLYKAFYPLIVITQTVPTVAIAPLLVLWFGYEMLPKVILIVIVTFFPITIGLLEGFRSADKDMMNLLRSMGAGRLRSSDISRCRGPWAGFMQACAYLPPTPWWERLSLSGWAVFPASVCI